PPQNLGVVQCRQSDIVGATIRRDGTDEPPELGVDELAERGADDDVVLDVGACQRLPVQRRYRGVGGEDGGKLHALVLAAQGRLQLRRRVPLHQQDVFGRRARQRPV